MITETFTVLGVPTDPTTVTFNVTLPDSSETTWVFGVSPQVTNPAIGVFVLTLFPSDVAIPGVYHYQCIGTGLVQATSEGDFTVLASSLTDDTTLPQHGPCTVWVDSQDVSSCCGDPVGVDLTQFAVEASQLLFMASGRQFPGVCERTVRPCSNNWCGFQVIEGSNHVIGPWDWGGGYGWSGSSWWWGNQAGCGCSPLDRIKLAGYPIREIVEVKIDGAVIPELNNYRLDQRRYLTRIADASGNVQFWPSCQHMNEADTEVGTFSVTYRYGIEPPLAGIHAARQLACELYQACTGGECKLPTGTATITRAGIKIERQFFARDKRTGTWGTGLNMVDLFLNTYNRAGLTRRPSIYSPNRSSRYPHSVG